MTVSFWDRTYIDRSLSCQFESGPHLYPSAIFLSVQFESGPRLYDRSLSVQFESGPHLYRSAISLSCQSVSGTAPISIGHYRVILSRGRTYIDRPSPCHVSQFLGPHLYQSVIFHVSLSRDRTYIDRSLSCQLESGAAPISIGHLPISLVRVGTAPI